MPSPNLMAADSETWKALKAMPESADPVEWPVEQTLAAQAPARIFWPLGDTRLARRLPFLPGAAHLAELDRPDEAARAVLDWTN